MADKSEYAKRFGTLFLAGIFLFTSVGVTALAIWQTNSKSESEAEMQQQIDAQSQAQTEPTFCELSTAEPAPAEAAPEVFIPTGDVTELKTEDLVVGTGQEAKAGDCLVVKYHGTLATNGEKFDGNFDEETALQFVVGAGSVIPGWDQGLVGIKEGGTRRIIIPSELAYGEQGGGAIPPNSDLVFVVKLIDIKEQ